MKRTRNKRRLASRSLAAAGTAVAAFAVIVVALAQSASGWDLSFRATSGGGGRSSLGTLAVEGSIGQPFVSRSAQGSFAVTAGIFDSGPIEYTRRVPYVANDGLSPN